MDNNPLKQYFRRPAIYLKLPSQGEYYTPGSIELPENGELPIYPMTAVDEITTKTPDALFNGNAVVDIIKSCVPAIKDPWQIPLIDLDPLLVAIRTATNGNSLDIVSQCPSCEEESNYGINLGTLLTSLRKGEYDKSIRLQDLEFKFRPLTFKEVNEINQEQFSVQVIINQLDNIQDDNEREKTAKEATDKLTEMSLKLVSQTIDSIATPTTMVKEKEFIIDFLKNCEKQTYDALRETAIKMRQSSEIQPIDIKCVNCAHEYTQPLILNPTDFFA